MKRILSLLVVFAMVIAMVPNVFAAKDSIDMDELLGKLVVLDSIETVEVVLEEGSSGKTYHWTPTEDGALTLTLTTATEGTTVNYTVSQGETSVEAVDGTASLDVVAGTKVVIVVSEANKAAAEAVLTGVFLQENNTEAEPILVDFVWNQEQTEATATVTAEPGVTYYGAYKIGGMALSINGGEATLLEGNPRVLVVFPVTNDGDAAAEYTLTVTYPVGSRMNPEVLEELNWYWGEVALAENNNEGYYYSYTAPADGSVELYFIDPPEGVTGDIVVSNQTTYELKSLLADGVDNYGLVLTVAVSEGDELLIQIVVVPGADWSIPAAEFNWMGNFTYPEGTEQNPIVPEWQFNEEYTEATATVTVPAGETVYVAGNGGMMLSINGGEPTLMQSAGFGPMAPPVTFTLTNDGTADAQFALKIWWPEGTDMNPAQLVIGENTATVAEGSQGYYYSWTAEKNGKLTITMPEGNWFYVVNNMTSWEYGENQYSDADPAMTSTTIDVKAGDEIEVQVNTYDPENPWTAPAGSITFTAAFEEITYMVGDLDDDSDVDEDDAIYLLQYVLLGDEMFAVNQPVDFDKSGAVDEDDAIYLLQHVLLGDIMFPLN